MIDKQERLAQLVAMSRKLGDPAADCVILGEGNTSMRATDDTFFVKASGFQLPSITESGFTEVRFEPVLTLLDSEDISDATVKRVLAEARASADAAHPSVETILHALLLRLPGIEFVGHTHPTAVNSILCARRGHEAFAGRLFPDEIVCCGPQYLWVPWTDPGASLARAVNQGVGDFMEQEGLPPKVILMQNHGMIALGPTPAAVENGTAMMVKTARVLLGTYVLGGPNLLPSPVVDRIFKRPDEKYREKLLESRD
jgi:rhamnose utilization protein RhaD (predicted bifunctional aldolase and dehydrogenase)